MMENYDDIRLEHVKTKEICSVGEMSIERDTDFPHYGVQSQNLNFGAEILSTKLDSATSIMMKTAAAQEEATSENQWKTNCEIKTKTLISTLEQQQQLQPEEQEAEIRSTTSVQEQQQDAADEECEPDNKCNSPVGDKLDCSEQSDGEETSSSDTDCSEMSGLSDISEQDWKPTNAPFHIKWVQKQMHSGRDPRDLLSMVLPNSNHELSPGTSDMMLWHMLSSMLSSCGDTEPKRRKLRNINTFDDVLHLVQTSQRIIVLTGAGVSVSCGIPDFRSSNGIYSRLARDFPDLPDPQAMFDINYFCRDPRPFYKFAREIYPGQFEPSPGHRFIKMLEKKNKLLRNYTQNIDTLEQVAGIRRVIECHGSFSTASCTKCKFRCGADDIRSDIFAQRIPVCPRCQPNKEHSVKASVAVNELEMRQLVENGIMKPDIVFFGEGLPDEFHTVMATDKDECDLLIVMGSSLKVRPVNYIPSSIPATVPQILINREKLHHLEFDVELLGDSDVIINQLCHRLGADWRDICYDDNVLIEANELITEQQQQDTDTQSLKSNASTDYLLNSACGACSDSGFESSTFSTVNVKRATSAATAAKLANLKANEAIEKIKTDILVELNETQRGNGTTTTAPNRTAAITTLSNEVPITTSESCERLAEPASATPTMINNPGENHHRHLPIDSSKESGMEQCETSNLGRTTTGPSLPPLDNFGDTGGTLIPGAAAATVPNITNNSSAIIKPTYQLRHPLVTTPPKKCSGAERLHPGTYYCLGNNRSYVFPGAQVFIDEDFDDTDDIASTDTDQDEREEVLYDDDVDDVTDVALGEIPLASLLPSASAVAAQIVTEISSSTAVTAIAAATTTTTTTTNNTSTAIPSPNKKRRSSSRDLTNNSVVADNATSLSGSKAAATLAAACQSNSVTQIAADGGASEITVSSSKMMCSPPPVKKRRPSSCERAFLHDYPHNRENNVAAPPNT